MKYSTGATMAYSLNAHMPFEGFRVAFNGELDGWRCAITNVSRGRLPRRTHEIHLTKSFGERRRVPLVAATTTGGHGGGDTRLRDLIFRKADGPEHMKLPDSRAGAMSCLTGIAARKSVDEKRAIRIADLVKL